MLRETDFAVSYFSLQSQFNTYHFINAFLSVVGLEGSYLTNIINLAAAHLLQGCKR